MTSDPLAPVRWLDVIGVLAATPFALLMGVPALGFVVGGAAWIVARLIGHVVERRAKAAANVRTEVGLTLFSGLGRAWLVAVAILVVGVAGAREDGLTAAVLAFAAFTVYLAVGFVVRPRPKQPTVS